MWCTSLETVHGVLLLVMGWLLVVAGNAQSPPLTPQGYGTWWRLLSDDSLIIPGGGGVEDGDGDDVIQGS